ncbi:cation efflux family-domain-containing protein [Yarrowia lipolytica]|uniref:Zinc transporter n=2 Tax=Yarrowia lipolytica TaxID=4952 RepID=Q6CFY3_YARLI|nr:YALI0B02552p [Yarrowia lipolytica CLIB122]AOW01129.1 hypothetical protein YALI1_B03963g [Yarrowia lipolytica]KAB8285242.1 cation efflux family-domain-containing protein [Yarrowia lipolytica]KAE8174866.1 cation efflux family-domain-containing protein [Yarrowia lipolytica]KAJ8052022.1 cation efflux family-domain-containing protein [Yarrowia lipolytica]QNP96299.1 Protein ZRG17 [Yarrowia lipolytica]|eukprot:XP_500429.1 YALI0B02552p [Yarrowia lipolytica CLIB122]
MDILEDTTEESNYSSIPTTPRINKKKERPSSTYSNLRLSIYGEDDKGLLPAPVTSGSSTNYSAGLPSLAQLADLPTAPPPQWTQAGMTGSPSRASFRAPSPTRNSPLMPPRSRSPMRSQSPQRPQSGIWDGKFDPRADSNGFLTPNNTNATTNTANNSTTSVNNANPFNFEQTTYSLSPPVKPSQRRGHRYKHSSVSINFFEEPNKAPLAIPKSHPIPNAKEALQSMSRDQRARMCWSGVHLLAAFVIFSLSSHDYTALAALAHLVLYDALGATLTAAVDILGNFEVWKKSSIHHPFGLQRAEVLAGFALSVALIFMGGDLLSHSVETVVEVFYDADHVVHDHNSDMTSVPHADDHGHRNTHGHGHGHSKDGTSVLSGTDLSITILALLVTVISAYGLKNHQRIGKAMRHNTLAQLPLPSFLSNPSHLMTITSSLAIISYLLFPGSGSEVLDSIVTPIIALSMCYVGWQLAKSLGGMLIMSFPGVNRISDIEQAILAENLVKSVSDVSFWQVHHNLCLVSMRIEMNQASSMEEQALKARAAEIAKNILTPDYEDMLDQVRWETTIDITR